MTYDRQGLERREGPVDSLLISESFLSVKCLTVAMRQTLSTGKSGSSRGISSGTDVSPGRRRQCMSKGSNRPAPSARQSTRPEESDGLRDIGIPCQNCHTKIPYIADWVIVWPCGHTLCNLCCLTSHVERGCTPHTCPVVGCNCFSNQLEYMRCGGSSSNTIINRVVVDDQYIKRHLPTLWLKQQHQSEITETPENEGVVISCSKIRQKENGKLDVKSITSTFVIKQREGMPAKALDPNRALVYCK